MVSNHKSHLNLKALWEWFEFNIFANLIVVPMSKITYVFILFILLSCGESQQTEVVQEVEKSSSITKEDIAQIKYTEYVVDPKVAVYTENWNKYTELNDIIAKLKLGDYSYFQDNQEILSTLLTDLQKTIPAELNSPSVMARLVAVENACLKLESLANLSNIDNEEMVSVIGEVLIAFNNMSLQMNKKLERESQQIYKP